MALLPPDNTGRRDRTKEENARKRRVQFARDVGDEQGLAWQHEPRRKRSKFTIGTTAVFAAFVILGALPLILHKGDGALLQPDCGAAAIESGPSRIQAGTNFAWQAAGPDSGQYVVVVGGESVSGPTTGPVTVSDGTLLAGPLTLTGCRSAQTVAKGPATKGDYEVALFHSSGGGWDRVAVTLLNVS